MFDITVEGNRPDAWSMAGIARDLAARLGLPFTLPEPPAPPSSGLPVTEAARASVEDLDLCPRLTVSVLARRGRRALASMDRRSAHPGRHAPDQQRGRRVELCDARARATHPSLRPGTARWARAHCAPCRARRDRRDARRRDPHDRGHRCGLLDLRRRKRAGGRGGDHGWRLVGDRRLDVGGAARGGLLHAYGHRPHLQAAGPADRGLGALRAGVRPLGHRCRRQSLQPAPGGERAGPHGPRRHHRHSRRGARAVHPRGADRPGAATGGCAVDRGSDRGTARSHRIHDDHRDWSRFRSRPGRRGVPLRPGADQSARCAPGALRDRRRHRGSGPDFRVCQHPAAHADVAAAGPSHRIAAVAPTGQAACSAASGHRRVGPTRSSPRRRIAGWGCRVRRCGCPTRS